MGEQDPLPRKQEQYARWRILREQHEWNERLLQDGEDPAAEYVRQLYGREPAGNEESNAPAPMLHSAAARRDQPMN